VKLSRYLDQKTQETMDCQQSIVRERQTAEKLREDIRLARREKELALAKKQKEVDELMAAVSCSAVYEYKKAVLSQGNLAMLRWPRGFNFPALETCLPMVRSDDNVTLCVHYSIISLRSSSFMVEIPIGGCSI